MKSIRRQATAIVCVTMLVGSTSVATLMAQGGNPLDLVLSKLDQILAALMPPTGSVTLATPALQMGGGLAFCTAANVGTGTIPNVRYRALDSVSVIAESEGALTAGETDGIFFTTSTHFVRCEFSYEGTAAMVRANLQVVNERGTISADAR